MPSWFLVHWICSVTTTNIPQNGREFTPLLGYFCRRHPVCQDAMPAVFRNTWRNSTSGPKTNQAYSRITLEGRVKTITWLWWWRVYSNMFRSVSQTTCRWNLNGPTRNPTQSATETCCYKPVISTIPWCLLVHQPSHSLQGSVLLTLWHTSRGHHARWLANAGTSAVGYLREKDEIPPKISAGLITVLEANISWCVRMSKLREIVFV